MRNAIVIPTYNESDNLPHLVGQVRLQSPDSHILVVDDNSPDGTGRLADELAKADEHISVLHRPAKLGLGSAHIAGFKLCLASGAETVLTMDADFSHSPVYLPSLLQGLGTLDVVIGSRYVPGGGTRLCSYKRQALSLFANGLTRTALGLRARDCTAGFRAYRRSVLESIALDEIFSNGYSFLIEMLYQCQRRGWRIGEIPIVFEDRRRGVSKISREEIFRAVLTIFRLRLEAGRLSRPVLHPSPLASPEKRGG